eukprot:3464170-Rhodomonas_salina.1
MTTLEVPSRHIGSFASPVCLREATEADHRSVTWAPVLWKVLLTVFVAAEFWLAALDSIDSMRAAADERIMFALVRYVSSNELVLPGSEFRTCAQAPAEDKRNWRLLSGICRRSVQDFCTGALFESRTDPGYRYPGIPTIPGYPGTR